ncbi:MAG: metal-dependent hydrolase [Clostridia bacterium]|nr:metal-dependent hydrolase [Clostridia bacterium]
MEPVTHALTGYVISNVFYKNKNNMKMASLNALSIVTIMGATVPDIDSLARYFRDNTFYFMFHRTITHSPLGLFILSVLCAFIVKVILKDQKYGVLLFGALLGAVSHVLLDLTNVYSTLALWPFSNRMYSLGLLPIYDLYIISIYVISISLTLFKPLRTYKRKIFGFVLVALTCYIGLKIYVQFDLKDYIVKEYEKGSFTETAVPKRLQKISILGTSYGINAWRFIIENEDEFVKGDLNFNDRKYANVILLKKEAKDAAAIKRAQETPLGEFLLRFSPYIYYRVSEHKEGTLVTMSDLRFNFRVTGEAGNKQGRSHTFGGYVLLDQQNTPVYWSTQKPQSQMKAE